MNTIYPLIYMKKQQLLTFSAKYCSIALPLALSITTGVASNVLVAATRISPISKAL